MVPDFTFTDNVDAPAIITLGQHSTPVWIQQRWQEGEYAVYIRNNGCGHCCTAMALNLHGTKINPHEEFCLCRELWGEPREDEPILEAPFQSVGGIVKILSHFNVKAHYFGIPTGKAKEAAEHIKSSLENEKTVIFWSHPSIRLADNPFSPGEHYVYAVGIDNNGKILIANSSNRSGATNGIQYTDSETIEKALFEGCEPHDFTWGRHHLSDSGGYVVIG